MGYRSEVAYAVVFHTTEDRDKIINKLTLDQWALIKDEVTVEDDRILYHDQYVKWTYPDYANVNAHKALLAAAEEAHDEYTYYEGAAVDNPGVPSLGILIRLGEDDIDTERSLWGDGDPGMPEWYDLVDYTREIRVGWAE